MAVPDSSNPEFLVEAIIPSEEVHILGGPSGSGKTRWLFQTLMNWQNRMPVLGYPSHPVPYVYVSTDRSLKSVHRTLKDLGISPSEIPLIAAVEREPKGEQGYNVPWLLKLVEEEHPQAKLIVCEGLATFVPQGKTNDYAPVAKFLRALTREMQRTHKTFLGVHHTSKSKDEKGYENPREKLMGSAAWAAFAETIFVLDFFSSKDTENPYRRLHILPRNHAPNQVRNYRQLGPEDGGRLLELTKAQARREMPSARTQGRQPDDEITLAFERFFTAIETMGGKTFTASELEKAVGTSASRSTIFRRLKELEELRTVSRVGDGSYVIVRQSLADVFLPQR